MKISIVTISYNQKRFLSQAIESVFSQGYPDLQYIIIDGGSTDGSVRILEQAARRGAVVVSEPDGGPADALNKGFSLANGDIYGFINSDDLLYTHCVTKIFEAFEKRRNIDVVTGHIDVVNEDGEFRRRVYSDRFSAQAFAYGACTIAQQATFFKADVFHRTGGFNRSNRVAWDGELWLSMAEHGARFGLIDEVLGAFRVWPGTISSNRHHTEEFERYRAEMFGRVMGRRWRPTDRIPKAVYRVMRYAREWRSAYERIVRGPVVP